MRRIITAFITMLFCFSVAIPAFAANETFVPSITYKDSPAIEEATMEDQNVESCIEITSIAGAKNKNTDITQEERDLLQEIYKALKDGSMTLPLDDEYVIRELVDLSFEYEDCRIREEHENKDQKLKEKSVTLTVDFDLGVGKDAEVVVMVYIDDKWQPIESVKNNGDGTVTCVFEDICPVAFLMKQEDLLKPVKPSVPQTGDVIGLNLGLWVGVMVASTAGIATLLIFHKKSRR